MCADAAALPICPHCQQSDQVGPISKKQGADARLAPPPEPKHEALYLRAATIIGTPFGGLGFILGLMVVGFVPLLLMFMLPNLLRGNGFTLDGAEGSDIAIGIGLWIALMIGSHFLDNHFERAHKQVVIPAWQKRLARWDTLMYCSRCNGVFFPDEGVFATPAQVEALLKGQPIAAGTSAKAGSSETTPVSPIGTEHPLLRRGDLL